MGARRKTRGRRRIRARLERSVAALGFALSLGASCLGCGSNEALVIGANDWVLVRRDEFDQLDTDFWELATHTFDQNRAWFTEQNATIENGALVLSVTKQETPALPAAGEVPKPYAAAELRTRAPFLYGRFRARARLAQGAGLISAFWGFYDRYAIGDAPQLDNQIVIEGVNGDEHLLRYAVVVPDIAPAPETRALAFDTSEGWHRIGFDWTPTEVRFYIDDVVQSVVSGAPSEALRQYQRLVLSSYPSYAAWSGVLDDGSLPTAASFDWVEIYEYGGPRL